MFGIPRLLVLTDCYSPMFRFVIMVFQCTASHSTTGRSVFRASGLVPVHALAPSEFPCAVDTIIGNLVMAVAGGDGIVLSAITGSLKPASVMCDASLLGASDTDSRKDFVRQNAPWDDMPLFALSYRFMKITGGHVPV